METTRTLVAFFGCVVVALLAIGGWFGHSYQKERHIQSQHDAALLAAKTAALSMVNVDAASVDIDVRRILDSTTGTFHDDFAKRSKAFAAAVEKANSRSEGSVVEAAVRSVDDGRAHVLVVATMMMSAPATPLQRPQAWRMLMTVEPTDGPDKVSEVEFVQ
jgi:Mce-associated membrane protein